MNLFVIMQVVAKDELLLRFIDVAEHYCELMETASEYARAEFLRNTQRLLSALYSGALSLPDVRPDSNGVLEPEVGHDDWEQVFSSLRTKIGEPDLYWIVYDPVHLEEDDPVCGSLADDLADVYRDIKNGLLHSNNPDELADVVWEWKFSFETHWGHHATEALRVIHSLFYGPYALIKE